MLGSQVLLAAPDSLRTLGTDLSCGPGVDYPGADLTDAGAVAALLGEAGPLAGIIHCAAYTAVDQAEQEANAALAVNATAVANLAGWAAGGGDARRDDIFALAFRQHRGAGHPGDHRPEAKPEKRREHSQDAVHS